MTDSKYKAPKNRTIPEYWKLLIDKKYSFVLMYNYFMKGDIDKLNLLKKELALIQEINNKLKVKANSDDCKFKTRGSKRVIKILENSEKIDELPKRWSKKGKKKTLKTL